MTSKILHRKLVELFGENFQPSLCKLYVAWLINEWDGVISTRDTQFDEYLAKLISVPLEKLIGEK